MDSDLRKKEDDALRNKMEEFKKDVSWPFIWNVGSRIMRGRKVFEVLKTTLNCCYTQISVRIQVKDLSVF